MWWCVVSFGFFGFIGLDFHGNMLWPWCTRRWRFWRPWLLLKALTLVCNGCIWTKEKRHFEKPKKTHGDWRFPDVGGFLGCQGYMRVWFLYIGDVLIRERFGSGYCYLQEPEISNGFCKLYLHPFNDAWCNKMTWRDTPVVLNTGAFTRASYIMTIYRDISLSDRTKIWY